MLNQVAHQIFRDFSKACKLSMILLAIVVMCGCNQKSEKDVVKLDAPLEDVLPQITLVVPDQQGKDGKPLEITVGATYSGKSEYLLEHGETHELEYTFMNQHAVEGNKYIFAVASYALGGTGTFYYLTAVDKSTLKSVHEVLLGDRVNIQTLALSTPNTDSVTINYMDRESGTAMAEEPDKAMEKHFEIDQNELKEVSH